MEPFVSAFVSFVPVLESQDWNRGGEMFLLKWLHLISSTVFFGQSVQ